MAIFYWFLILWSIIMTAVAIYFKYRPKFELILTVEGKHNLYTLYYMYLKGKDEEVHYETIKLFTFKTKRK